MKKLASFCKEHKNYVALIILVIVLVTCASVIHEFKEKGGKNFNKEWKNNYERKLERECWRYWRREKRRENKENSRENDYNETRAWAQAQKNIPVSNTGITTTNSNTGSTNVK